MKAKELLEKAEKEIHEQKEKFVLEKIKHSLRNVLAAEKTLKAMKEKHEKLLETELEDFEDMEY